MNAERQPQIDSPEVEAEMTNPAAPQPLAERAEWEKQYDPINKAKKAQEAKGVEEEWQNQYAQVRDVNEAPREWAATQAARRAAHEASKPELFPGDPAAAASRAERAAKVDPLELASQQQPEKKWWQIWK